MIVLVGESSVDDFQKEVMLRAFRNFLRRAKHCRNSRRNKVNHGRTANLRIITLTLGMVTTQTMD
jgi:hypothetical protein